MSSDNLASDPSRYISNLVRQGDRDRYLAAILAPRHVQSHLLALYAFDLEIQAIPDRVSEPLAGEIRIQWWRDWLQDIEDSGRSGNPVADALGTAIKADELAVAGLQDYLDAWSSIFQHDAPDQSTMEAHLLGIEAPILSLTTALLTDSPVHREGDLNDLAKYAGFVRLLKSIYGNPGRLRYFVSSDMINQEDIATKSGTSGDKLLAAIGGFAEACRPDAVAAFNRLPETVRPAFGHLAAYSRSGPASNWRLPNPLMAQWRIWRSVRSGRL